jgi:hypothetical protein
MRYVGELLARLLGDLARGQGIDDVGVADRAVLGEHDVRDAGDALGGLALRQRRVDGLRVGRVL